MKQTGKLHQNVNEIYDNNQKMNIILKDKMIPIINTITSILATTISDSKIKNHLYSIIQTLSDEPNTLINPKIGKSTANTSIHFQQCN